MIWIYLSIGSLIAGGLFLICEDVFKLPFRNTRKSVISFVKIRNKNKPSRLTRLLDEFSVWISRFVKLDDYKKDQMNIEMEGAGISGTPEIFIAKCIVKGLLVLLLIIPCAFIFPIGVPIVIVAGIVTFLSSMNRLSESLAKKRKQIEYELPRFVSYISKTITHNRDVLSLLEDYLNNAGEAFGRELLITIADMKSGNYESAITRMETRVGSSMLSDVARGLVSVIRGDETITYWENLEIKFSDYQRQLLKQQAIKIPIKVRRLSLCLLICFIAFYVVILGMAIVDGLSNLF